MGEYIHCNAKSVIPMKRMSIGLLLLIELFGYGVAQIASAGEAQEVKRFCDKAKGDVRWFVQQRDAGMSKGMAWRTYKKRNRRWASHMRSYWKEVTYWVYVYPDMPETEVVSDAHFFCLAFPPNLPQAGL